MEEAARPWRHLDAASRALQVLPLLAREVRKIGDDPSSAATQLPLLLDAIDADHDGAPFVSNVRFWRERWSRRATRAVARKRPSCALLGLQEC